MFRSGELAGNALTGSFADIVTAAQMLELAQGGHKPKVIVITSSLDQAARIHFGDSANYLHLPAGLAGLVIDCRAADLNIGSAIQVRHDGSASSASTKISVLVMAA